MRYSGSVVFAACCSSWRADAAASHSERLKEYLAAMARFRRYSWNNVMLIAS